MLRVEKCPRVLQRDGVETVPSGGRDPGVEDVAGDKVKLLESHQVRNSVIGRRCGFGRDCPGLADWPWRLDDYRE